MQILQAVDLLRHRLVRLKCPEDTPDFSIKEHILLESDLHENIVAKVLKLPHEKPAANCDKEYRFVRKIKLQEQKAFHALQEEEKPRVIQAQKEADKLNLSMKFFASRTDLYGNTLSFFFTSEEQIDFRELLKVLGKSFEKKIHLERVGARDKAKIIGGFGSCGRETCCSTFKVELEAIPMNAARDQNLKIQGNENLFGLCGKLKCCLMYELPEYRELRKYLPHIRQSLETNDGKKGRVVALDILNQKVKLLLENKDTQTYDLNELKYESPT